MRMHQTLLLIVGGRCERLKCECDTGENVLPLPKDWKYGGAVILKF